MNCVVCGSWQVPGTGGAFPSNARSIFGGVCRDLPTFIHAPGLVEPAAIMDGFFFSKHQRLSGTPPGRDIRVDVASISPALFGSCPACRHDCVISVGFVD